MRSIILFLCTLIVSAGISAQTVAPFVVTGANTGGGGGGGTPTYQIADSVVDGYVDSTQVALTTTGTTTVIITAFVYEPTTVTATAKLDWVSATSVGWRKTAIDGGYWNIGAWKKLTVPAGTHTITIYTTPTTYIAGGATAYSGGDVASWTTNENSSTSASVTLAGASGKIIIGGIYADVDNSTSLQVTGTGHSRRLSCGGSSVRAIQSDLTESTSNPAWTIGGSGADWVAFAFYLQ